MGQNAVHTRGLERSFGDVTALSSLDLTVTEGELFGLVGPDGAGKTTTLRILAGILRPTGGRAEVLGVDIARRPGKVTDDLAYMPQRFGQYGDLSVAENIAFYAELYRVPKREAKQRTDVLLKASRMAPFKDRLARNLSGGMKQKMGLCCALIHQPKLMLLDEPTTGVDPVSRRDFWKILYDMRAEGVTIVMATTYLDEADRCDRVGLLSDGRLLIADEPARLRPRLGGALLRVTGPDPRRAKQTLTGQPQVKHVNLFGAALHVVVDDAAKGKPALKRALENAGLEPFEVEVVAPSLDDVYIALVERDKGGRA